MESGDLNTMGITNTAKEIRAAAISALETMYLYIEENRDITATPTTGNTGLPEFLTDPFDPTAAPLSAPTGNNDMSLIYSIHDALISHPEYLELVADHPTRTPSIATLTTACEESYDRDNSYGVAKKYIDAVLVSLNLKYDLGMPVRLTSKAVKALAIAHGHAPGDLGTAEWIVTAATGGSNDSSNH